MKTTIRLAVLAVLVLGLATLASAGDEKQVVVTGKVMCAKCSLKKADATECQNVLVAKGAGDTMVEYYLVKNEVTEAFGHKCTGEKAAAVAGTVEEKDGKMWLTAKKIEEPK
jgi:uncharacterized membrane protein